jgi:phage I-like protein
MKRLLFTAANDTPEIAAANADGGEGVFELVQGDSLFVPFGEYPHTVGLQIFNAESGTLLEQAFNSLPAKLSRIFTPGAPVYFGHPDVPGRPDSDPAAPACGWINSVSCENDGVRFGVKWGESGQRAIANAEFRFYSPNWLLRKVKGGIQPVKLLSMGLTNNPRIPVPAIANDNSKENTMPQWIIDLLITLGLLTPEQSSDDALVQSAAAKVSEKLNRLREIGYLNEEIARLTASIATANDSLTAVTGERESAAARVLELEAALTAANDGLAAARAYRIDTELEALTSSGRILIADQEARRTELLAIANDADLAAALTELGNLAPVIGQATAHTASLGQARSKVVTAANDISNRREKIREAIHAELELVRAENSAIGANAAYDLAFSRAKKKHETLFAAQAAE